MNNQYLKDTRLNNLKGATISAFDATYTRNNLKEKVKTYVTISLSLEHITTFNVTLCNVLCTTFVML